MDEDCDYKKCIFKANKEVMLIGELRYLCNGHYDVLMEMRRETHRIQGEIRNSRK